MFGTWMAKGETELLHFRKDLLHLARTLASWQMQKHGLLWARGWEPSAAKAKQALPVKHQHLLA